MVCPPLPCWAHASGVMEFAHRKAQTGCGRHPCIRAPAVTDDASGTSPGQDRGISQTVYPEFQKGTYFTWNPWACLRGAQSGSVQAGVGDLCWVHSAPPSRASRCPRLSTHTCDVEQAVMARRGAPRSPGSQALCLGWYRPHSLAPWSGSQEAAAQLCPPSSSGPGAGGLAG